MTQIEDTESNRWARYYKATAGRKPRKLLLEALAQVGMLNGVALDLGAGDLTDSRYLLQRGFSVVAVDSSPASREAALTITSPDFSFVQSQYDTYEFPQNHFDLITAQLALPFNKPESFENMFSRLKSSLKQGGVFTGHFFGPRDEWNTPDSGMSFHNEKEVEALFSGFEFLRFSEEEADQTTAGGRMKHWHIIEVISLRLSKDDN